MMKINRSLLISVVGVPKYSSNINLVMKGYKELVHSMKNHFEKSGFLQAYLRLKKSAYEFTNVVLLV